VLLGIVTWSVEEANWITPQPSLFVALALALVTGLLLARSRLPGVAAHTLAMVLGAGLAVWQGANLLPVAGMSSKVAYLVEQLQLWWQATNAGEPNPGTIQVALMFICLTWIIGYLSTWFTIRRKSPWVAIFLGAIGLLLNLSNLRETSHSFFFFYLLAALLLMAQTTWVRHYSSLRKHPIRYPKRSIGYFLASVFCLSTLMLSLAWPAPEFSGNPVQTWVRENMPWRQDIEDYWQNFFAAVYAQKPTLSHGGSDTLDFAESPDLSDDVFFIVHTKRPRYWRTRTYDIYTSGGWLTSPTTDQILMKGVTKSNVALSSPTGQLTYTVTPVVSSNVLLTTGELASSTITTMMKTLTPLVFDIDLSSSTDDNSLPSDIASIAKSWRDDPRSRLIAKSQLARSLPGDLTLVDLRQSDGQTIEVSVSRRGLLAKEVIAFSTLQYLEPYEGYTITTQLPIVTHSMLAQAGNHYPPEITDRYLQLPPNFPERVRHLAQTVTKDAETAYDKAMAIRQFLADIPYSTTFQAPPKRSDGVDYFLFTTKTGDCTYFASAAVVMLRSVGVPSRLGVGYLPGEYDDEQKGYIIKEASFHVWPEVYFPSYGWIELEVTPGRGFSNVEDTVGVGASGFAGTLGGGFSEFEDEGLDDYAGLYPGGGTTPPGNVPAEDTPGSGSGSSEKDSAASGDEDMTLYPGEDVATLDTSTAIWLWPALAVLGIIILFIFGLLSYRRLGYFTGHDTAKAIYSRMCFLSSLAKLGPQPQQTALEYGSRLGSVFPQQTEAIANIVQSYTLTRYSRDKTLGAIGKRRVQQSWHQLRLSLFKRLFRIK
jgi:hypothetical protein